MAVDRSLYWRLSLVYLLYYASLGGWLPFWGIYLQQRGYSPALIATAISVIVLMRIPGPMVFGWLADRRGNHLRLVRLGSFMAALSFSALLLVPDNYWCLLLLTAITGFFWAGILPQFETVTLARLGTQTSAYSLVRLWGSVGFVLAVVATGWLLSWQTATVLLPLLTIMLAAIWLGSLLLPADRRSATPTAIPPLLPLLRRPGLVLFLCSCVLMQVSHGPYYVFFSIHLSELGFGSTAIGMLWALAVLAEIVLLLVLPGFLWQFGIARLLLLSLALTVLRWLLTAVAEEQLSLLILAQILHAASFGSFHAAGIEWIRRVSVGGYAGRAQSLYNSAGFGAGSALGAWASGLLWPLGAFWSFLAAAVAASLALLLMWGGCRAAAADAD